MRALARILPLGVLAVLAAAAVAGCGGGVLDPVAQAATTTADAGSYRFTYSLSAGAQAVEGTGAFDATAKRLRMSLSGLGGGSFDSVMDMASGPVMYVRWPGLGARLPAGKTWFSVDLGQAAKASGFDLGQLSTGQLDPARAFDALKASKYSTKVGTERVDGVQATHYVVTIDPKQLVAGASAAERKLTEKLLEASGLKSYAVDVWVDDAGLLRRIVIDLGTGIAPVPATMRMDFSDYGGDVRVDLPPAAEVADVTQSLATH